MKVLMEVETEQLKKWLHEEESYDRYNEKESKLYLELPLYRRYHPEECECWKRTDEGRGRCFETKMTPMHQRLLVHVIHG